jgi:hypothetical protein
MPGPGSLPGPAGPGLRVQLSGAAWASGPAPELPASRARTMNPAGRVDAGEAGDERRGRTEACGSGSASHETPAAHQGPWRRGGKGVPVRCLECGTQSAGATQVCARCGAPITYQRPVSADRPRTGGPTPRSPVVLVQPPPELPQLTEAAPARTQTAAGFRPGPNLLRPCLPAWAAADSGVPLVRLSRP